jgi:putative ABC transport system ATP-binding protein
MLRAEALAKTFRTGAVDVEALAGVDARFPAGRLTAIVGPSGSGKSTLLNLLAGFDVPTSGAVFLGSENLALLSEQQRCDLRLHRFGFVFQSFNLVNVLTAEQNVAFPMALAGVAPRDRVQRARQLLARFGLSSRTDHLPHRLSGGERQRVALARALANDPDVVFADEPTGNLDSKSGAHVLEALAEVAAEGRTVIIVTHDLGIADRADERVELRDGVVVAASRSALKEPLRTPPEAAPVGAKLTA